MISTHALRADQIGLGALQRRNNQRYGWYENWEGINRMSPNISSGTQLWGQARGSRFRLRDLRSESHLIEPNRSGNPAYPKTLGKANGGGPDF